jgi:AcrR family transcriptional regulator
MPVSGRPRWRRRKEARPSEIIAAALESFAERGFAATRLDDIAARAGVTRGTLYLYFSSKEELFKAVVRQSIVPILARAEDMLSGSTEPTADLLTKLILSFPDAVIGSQISAIPKLVIAEARNFPDLARFYLEEVVRRGRRLIKALIQRGIERGEFRSIDENHAFYCVMSPILVAMLWKHSLGLYDETGLDPHALCRAHVELLLRGLLKRGEGP